MKPVPHGEPYAGKLHVRFDEGAGAPHGASRSTLHPAPRDCRQGNAAVKCVANSHIFYAHIFIIAIASRTTCVVEYQAEASKASRRSIMRKRR